MAHARMKPDGTVELGSDSYRLVEIAHTHFRVERVRDGTVMGEVKVPATGKPETTSSDSNGASVVQAIAELLEGPRGLLPLQ